jgi:hypothetical protein
MDTLNRVKTKDPHFPYKGYECLRCGHVVVFDSIRTVLGHGTEDIAFAAYCNKECVDVLSSSYDAGDVFFSAMKVLGGTSRYPEPLNILFNTFMVFPDDDEPPYFF